MNPGKYEDFGFIHNFISSDQQTGLEGRGRGRARVLLLLHGTGGNEDDLLTIGQMLDPKASILAPRGKILENGMPRYFRRLAAGVFDIEDLKYRTNELVGFVKGASSKYVFDIGSVVAVGYSNGANIAASMLLLFPGLIKSAILFRAMMPLVPESKPDLSGTRVFLSGGKFDTMIPEKKTDELKRYLEKSGAQVKVNWENSTHSLTSVEIEKAKSWLLQNQ